MALIRLSAAELLATPSAPVNEYARFIAGLDVGEGGKAMVKAEGVSRQSVKTRLKAAATDVGAEIKFHRTASDEVIFEVTGAATRTPTGRRRWRRSTAKASE